MEIRGSPVPSPKEMKELTKLIMEAEKKYKQHNTENCGGVKFLLVGMTDSLDSSADLYSSPVEGVTGEWMTAWIEEYSSALKDAMRETSSEDLYNRGGMDFQHHLEYGRQAQALEGVTELSQNMKLRVKALTVNTTTHSGYDKVEESIQSNQEAAEQWMPYMYTFYPSIIKAFESIRKAKDKRIVTLEEVAELCGNGLGKFNHVYDKILRIMHSWGQVLYFGDLHPPLAVVDIDWFLDILRRLHTTPPNSVEREVTSVHKDTPAWKDRELTKMMNIDKLEKPMVERLMALLLECDQFLRLHGVRRNYTDPKYYVIHPQYLHQAPVSLDTYLSDEGSTTLTQSIMMEFLTLPLSAWYAMLASCTRFCQPVAISDTALIFHQGAAEIVITYKAKGIVKEIEIKGRIYSGTEDKSVYCLTYLYSIMNIYCDIISHVTQKQALIGWRKVDETIAFKFANKSVSSNHAWEVGQASSPIEGASVCVLCGNCSQGGISCPNNGVVGEEHGKCPCRPTRGCCKDCGLCFKCVDSLWSIRSELRPACDVEKNRCHSECYMDHILNEATFTITKSTAKSITEEPICLISKDTSFLIHAFPGRAVMSQEAGNYEHRLRTSALKPLMPVSVGDTIKLRLREPQMTEGPEIEKAEGPARHQRFFYHLLRECKLWQSSGVVRYDGNFTDPVSLMASEIPLTPGGYFELEILDYGDIGAIAIGLVPKYYPYDQQPGWRRDSIGYHADDGGIFVEEGHHSMSCAPCQVGDKMGCGMKKPDSSSTSKTHCIYFTKNGEQVTEVEFGSVDKEYFAAVGMHSSSETIQLLPSPAWAPPLSKLAQLDIMNKVEDKLLTISPGRRVEFPRRQDQKSTFVCKTFIEVNRKSKKPVLVKVKVTNTKRYRASPNRFLLHGSKDSVSVALTLSPGEASEGSVVEEDLSQDQFLVQWAALPTPPESTSPTDAQIKAMWDKVDNKNIKSHKIGSGWGDSQDVMVEKLEYLPKTSDGTPAQPSYELEVSHNGTVVNKVWIPRDKYIINVASKKHVENAGLIFTQSKFPSAVTGFSRDILQGQQMLVGITPDHKQAIQYFAAMNVLTQALDQMKKDNTTLYVLATLHLKDGKKMFHITFPGDVIKLTPEECTQHLFHDIVFKHNMVPEDGSKGLSLPRNSSKYTCTLENGWYTYEFRAENDKKDILCFPKDFFEGNYNPHVESFSSESNRPLLKGAEGLPWMGPCLHSTNSFAVLEHSLRMMHDSMIGRLASKDHHPDFLVTFLPMSLSLETLLYPSLADLHNMQRLAVHKLCRRTDVKQLVNGEMVSNLVHFVDKAGVEVVDAPHPSYMYEDVQSLSKYCLLASKNMRLPVYKKLLQLGENADDLIKEKIEQRLHAIVKIYASTCYLMVHANRSRPLQTLTGAADWMERWITATGDSPLMDIDRRGVCDAHAYTEFLVNSDNVVEKMAPLCEILTMATFNLEGKEEAIPDNLHIHMPGLQVLEVTDADALSSLPRNLSQMFHLKKLSVRKKSQLCQLPGDIGDCQSLIDLVCYRSCLTQLPTSLERCRTLQRLSVHNSLLSGLPEGMGRLQSLTYLDISSNPITKLPPSFHELTSLKTLKLSGVPWRILSGPGAFARLSDHASWIAENEENTKILGKEKMLEMLKEKEISSDLQRHKNDLIEVNTEIYFEVPRLGHDYEEWDTDGGIPIEIFDLVNLEVLELKHQAIRSVPPEIINLTKLHTLNLNHCPQLESLPGAMGDLPALQTLNLRSCPSLRTPPNEVVGRGTAAVLGYLKRLEAGFTRNWRTKLMLVGLGGAGKTSLLRALMSSDKTTTGTTADEVTDGIDIKTWSVSHKGGATVTYSAWDFAGQSVYYNTHQFFLSSRAVYLLLWTTRQGYEHAGLEFWLSSIQCHAPKAPIFIVATHADQVSKTRADLPMKDLRKRYPQIQGFHFVSSIQGTGIQELETAIVEATLKESYMGEKVPTVYLNLEKSILKVRQDSSTMKWKDVKKCGMEVGIYNEKDISRAVQFLHDLGTVQYFDNEFLREYIVIDPQWIVDVMACVVSIKDSPIKAGSLHHCDIDKVWSKFPRELYDWLLRLTEAFDLTFPIPNQKVNMVPCLLPPHEPEVDLFPSIEGKPGWRQTMMLYKFAYLPAGLFNRMQVRLFQFSDSDIIWKRGSRLRKNEHLALVKQLNDRELVVTVQGPRPENILFLVHEVIESLIMENFRGVHYDYLIPCPDCVQRVGLDNPKMHKGSKIREAANWNAPFLQCTRYFHIVSMAILQALVPPDSSNEFEVHLEQSVHNLSSLLANLSTDILISYCGADVPTTPEQAKKQVHPARVSEALVKQGYSVWYHDNMDKLDVHDVTMAVQDSKIVVFFMSDQFEKDEACRRLFLHTVESLRKPFVLVVVGTGMDWQKTNVGYVIGPQEVFIRMKVVDDFYENTFPLKMIELQEAIGSKLKSLFPEEKEHVCFLSYAWSNSAQCVQRGTKKIPGALGKVDPRQIGQELKKRGISCWIDYEHVGKNNLFEDIRLGLDQCSMAVLCVSEQYAKSKNCMMELRYAMVQLEKPAVIVLVGTGDGWMDSEIPIHVQRSKSTRLDMQHSDDPQLFDRLEELVKERIPKDREAKKAQRKMDQGPQMDLTNISYHEELELAQRKFQRHLAMLADKMDSLPYPRLVVLDFLPEEVEDKNKDEKTGRPKSGRSQPRASRDGKTQISKRKSRINDAVTTVLDDEDDDTNLRMEREQSAIMEEETRSGADSKHGWSECEFCFRILCEADKGWHLSEHIVPLDDLSGVEIVNFVSLVAPYIGRMYAILTHSKIQLRCLNDDPTSLEFSTFVYNMAKNAPVDFTQAYCNMLEAVTKYSRKSTITLLKRCHLPTGKISWLCEGHQKDSRVTILSSDVATGGSHSAMVTEEDELMRDNLAKYEHLRDKYRTRKNEKPQQKAEEDKEEDKEVVPQRPKSGRPKVTPDEKTMKAAAAVLTGGATPPIKTPRHSRPSSAASSTSTATGRGQRTPSARARSERARQKFRAGADAAKVVSGWPGQPTSKACLIL